MRSWPSPQIPRTEVSIPPLRLRDTSRKVVAPLAAGETVGMYVCGITPYDATHIGHAATYLTFDVIHRLLLAQGKKVNYVQNVTDVDDPLFERAHRDNIDWVALGDRETDLFRSDMEALSVIPPTVYQGAIAAIPLVIAAVEKFLADGSAYIVQVDQFHDIYFSTDADPRFGYVSNYSPELMAEIFPRRGGDPNRPGKKNPYDALLWRAARPGEPSWDAPFGAGRPGWHIECSVIALAALNAPMDIQGGGSDLMYPHHEYSAAHGEQLTGVPRFARHYVHAGMIGLDGTKMSKSLGNLVLVSTLTASGVSPSEIRLALFEGHYSQDRDWSDDLLSRARMRWELWKTAFESPVGVDANSVLTHVGAALANDLDTTAALGALDFWAQDTLAQRGNDPEAPQRVAHTVDQLLGIHSR